ncbi:cytochrome c oxidase assembly protein subunit 15 [Modicisalibacter ilicicola DSM 19980]|uniref:Cytochrome c oxidase assembly protein subunit 15 n=1 Tax=Modicisalibacter ilicicola DSM 19980 TaxID=1121942 RepID=A0A1M4X7Q6_9GAMM|nr:COX15/CtaA family protein [Halomonas ilicicola]SHE89508.1 cytochrome c oxidase assembly protein subunit 15 [Halomonas ilicicola DSM 19980]
MAVSVEERRLRLARALSLMGVLLAFGVVLLGAWTRLVDAGLGCPDWPGCYGKLIVPDDATALAHTPHAPLDAAKAWAEMIHRYVASGLGLLVIGLVVLAWRSRNVPGYPHRTSWLLLGVILAQGAFGAFTVTLKLWPQVVTLHLLGGLCVTLLFLWLSLQLRRVGTDAPPRTRASWPGGLWLLAIVLLVGQLALGGWTSSNYAGIACQGVPTCNGQWWPDTDWKEGFNLAQTIGPNYLYGKLHSEARTAIHLAHRLGALALGVVLLLVTWRYWAWHALRPSLILLLGLYGVQVGLGIANVLLWLPLGLALAHTAGAVLLVLAMATTVWRASSLSGTAPGQAGRNMAKEGAGPCVA